MRRFIGTFLIMLAVIAACDQALGPVLGDAYSRVHRDEIGKLNYIADSAQADIVILGSSRALHHYVPRIITDSTGMSCYNCGIEGSNIFLNYALLRALLQRYRPRVVVYELQYGYDAMRHSQANNPVNKIRPMRQLRCRDSMLADIDPMERVRMLSGIYPYNSLIAEIWLASHRSNSPYNNKLADNGYVPQFGVIKPQHEPYPRFTRELDAKKMSYLKKLVEQCQSRLIVVTSPYFDPQPDMLSVHKPVVDLCKAHHVPYIYLAQDPNLVGKAPCWDDAGHLNDRGARIFTREMIHRAKKARPQLLAPAGNKHSTTTIYNNTTKWRKKT